MEVDLSHLLAEYRHSRSASTAVLGSDTVPGKDEYFPALIARIADVLWLLISTCAWLICWAGKFGSSYIKGLRDEICNAKLTSAMRRLDACGDFTWINAYGRLLALLGGGATMEMEMKMAGWHALLVASMANTVAPGELDLRRWGCHA